MCYGVYVCVVTCAWWLEDNSEESLCGSQGSAYACRLIWQVLFPPESAHPQILFLISKQFLVNC